MSLEDKMFLRFQKEKVIKARRSSLFNLDDQGGAEDAPLLTHKGQALGAANATDTEAFSDNEDDDEALGKDVVSGGNYILRLIVDGLTTYVIR